VPARVYEGMFLFDSNRYARDPGGVSGLADKLIEQFGGKMLASRLWEERRLAYTIRGQRKGTYWLTYFEFDGEKLTELNRQCEINDNILRHLFLKVEPRLVETLVKHARGETIEPEDVKESDGEAQTKEDQSKPAQAKAGADQGEPAQV